MNDTPKLICNCCKKETRSDANYCELCGYPLNDIPEVQKEFRLNYIKNRVDKENTIKKIKESRIILFVLASFTLLQGIIEFSENKLMSAFFVYIILTLIYLFLGIYTNKKPFISISIGAFIYVSIMILSAIVEPISLFQGIIFKILFIVAFTRAIYGSYKFKL